MPLFSRPTHLTHAPPPCPHPLFIDRTQFPHPTFPTRAQKATVIKAKPRIEANRVLVTGGAGFVGSHLCTYLVERGDHVRLGLGGTRGKGERVEEWRARRARKKKPAGGAGGGAHGRSLKHSTHPPLHSPLARRPQVICLDNFFTGSKENIAHLMDKVREREKSERQEGMSPVPPSLSPCPFPGTEASGATPPPLLSLSLSPLSRRASLLSPLPSLPPPSSPTLRSSATTSSKRSCSKSTRSTTWPARPRPSTTSTTPSKRSRRRLWGR